MAEVSLEIKNVGTRDGAEVTQLYIQYPEIAGEPPKQLRGFAKLMIPAGESRFVSLAVAERDIVIWNSEEDVWEIVSGEYHVFVGSSSPDVRPFLAFTVA